MNLSRRFFFKSAAAVAAMTIAEMQAMAASAQIKATGDVAEDDEEYWRSIRLMFPLTHKRIYLNNGTFGPSPYPVIEAVKAGLMENDTDGQYGKWEKTVEKLAGFVGADEKEIALTHNVTDGINIACWGVPLSKGDEVILTTHEHSGNSMPWMNRQKLHGIVVKKYTPAATAAETLNRISDLITPKTKVIATPHIPCTQGQVLPVKEICTLARSKGIFSLIDGAHGPGMIHLDLHDMGCDTYASCGHKWLLGPNGTGFLYVRKEFQEILTPYTVGAGSGDEDWDIMTDPVSIGKYAEGGHRYYAGTQSNGLYRGVAAAVDFMEAIGPENVYRRIKYLGKYTQDNLLACGSRIQMLTPTEERSRAGVTGFKIKGMNYRDFNKLCGEAKIRIRIVPENGLDSLRISTHIYNNPSEIDELIKVTKKAVS